MSPIPRLPATTRRNLVLLLSGSIIVILLLRTVYDPSLPSWISSKYVPESELIDLEPYIPPPSEAVEVPDGVRKFNEPQIAKLDAALASGLKCGETVETQLVMAGHNWALAYTWGATGGETYWLESFMKSAISLGHPVLLAPSSDGSWGPLRLAREYNRRYPGCTKMVLVDPGLVRNEIAETRRMKREGLKGWIPEHLLVGMDYFNDPRVILRAHGADALNSEWGRIDTPFGDAFRVSPNPHPRDNHSHFIPYAIDGDKIGQAFIPHSQRPHGQMYILGRNTGYLTKPHTWSIDVLEGLEEVIGGKVIIAMDTSENPDGTRVMEASRLENLGNLNRPRFYDLLAHSSVLVGMGGDPAVSPTPYEALFLGVPLINPIVEWDPEDKMNQDKWVTLHDWLRGTVGEPYVYNVFAGDVAGLHEAIKKAIARPIDSFVLPQMTPAAVKEQVRDFLAIDWKKLADDYVRNSQD